MRFMRMIIKSILYGAALLLPISMAGGSANAEGDGPASSKTQYAVATANRDATDVGMRILASGGSAADAAVAIQMVLGVVEPQSSGLGGGAIALYRTAGDRQPTAFDGLAKSPASYDPGASASAGFSHSGAAVGVPGALRMLEMIHQRYGKRPWGTLFQRAIELADTGFSVSPYLSRSLAAASRAGMAVPDWLVDGTGKVLAEGATARNTELAATLREIAADGANAFYVHLAETIVTAIQNTSLPGRVIVADLAGYQAVEREPLCLQLDQGEICSFPPPSYGGIAVLEMLGILEKRRTAPFSFLDLGFVHEFIEAGRLAEADRMAIVGDPDVRPGNVRGLIDPDYLKARAGLIRADSALANPVAAGTPLGASRPACAQTEQAPGPSTSEVSIVDAFDGALAMTTTINVNFGAWITTGGFILNDAMTNFSRPTDGGCPANAPAGSKRAQTAMAPVIATDASGAVVLVGGSAGAGEIVDYVAQAMLELASGRAPAEALDDGHISTARAPYPDSSGVVELEQGRSVAQFALPLQALGHKVRIAPLPSGTAFLVRRQGRWEGAADPRRDGVFASSP
jgi:gamma-glutamyltranspeptidase/glutathione hydrolase